MNNVRKYITSLISVYIAAACAFLCNIIFAKAYGAEMYGVIVSSIAFSSFAQILINWGADKRFAAELIENKDDIFSYTCAANILRVGILFLCILIFLYLEVPKTGWTGGAFFIWYCINALYPRGLADYKEKIPIQNILYATEKISSLIILLWAFFLEKGADASLIFLLIFIRASFILAQNYVLLNGEEKKSTFLKAMKNVLRNSRQNIGITLALIFNAFLIYGAQLIVKDYLDYRAVAKIGLSVQLCVVVQLFQTQVVRFFNKEIFSKSDEISLKYIHRKLVLLLGPSFILAALATGGAYFLEVFILDPSYSGLYLISLSLIPWITILGGGLVVSQVFIATFNNKYYTYISFLTFCVSLTLSLLLIPRYGEVAFSVQLFLAHGLGIFLQYYVVRNKIRDNYA